VCVSGTLPTHATPLTPTVTLPLPLTHTSHLLPYQSSASASQLRAAIEAGDAARARAQAEAAAHIRAADASREEATARTLGSYERSLAALRRQLAEAVNSGAAEARAELTAAVGAVHGRLREMQAEREEHASRVEAAADAALAEAAAQVAAARAEAASEAAARRALEASVRYCAVPVTCVLCCRRPVSFCPGR
jgi:hypothetical protein